MAQLPAKVKVVRTECVKSVDVEDWKVLSDTAVRAGLSMSELIHVFASVIRERIPQVTPILQVENRKIADARRAHLRLVLSVLFPESPRRKR